MKYIIILVLAMIILFTIPLICLGWKFLVGFACAIGFLYIFYWCMIKYLGGDEEKDSIEYTAKNQKLIITRSNKSFRK